MILCHTYIRCVVISYNCHWIVRCGVRVTVGCKSTVVMGGATFMDGNPCVCEWLSHMDSFEPIDWIDLYGSLTNLKQSPPKFLISTMKWGRTKFFACSVILSIERSSEVAKLISGNWHGEHAHQMHFVQAKRCCGDDFHVPPCV